MHHWASPLIVQRHQHTLHIAYPAQSDCLFGDVMWCGGRTRDAAQGVLQQRLSEQRVVYCCWMCMFRCHVGVTEPKQHLEVVSVMRSRMLALDCHGVQHIPLLASVGRSMSLCAGVELVKIRLAWTSFLFARLRQRRQLGVAPRMPMSYGTDTTPGLHDDRSAVRYRMMHYYAEYRSD